MGCGKKTGRSRMLDQSVKNSFVNQLVCVVEGVLVFIAESEWRGGEQKKGGKNGIRHSTCLTFSFSILSITITITITISLVLIKCT